MNLSHLPPWFGHMVALALGLCVGSFLNVVIARLPKGQSLARPGSRCPSCKRPIRWYDNVPLASFALLRGRCRACGKRISARYPAVEALTALLFLAAEVRFGFGPLSFVHDWPFLALLVAITFIDLDHRTIPDKLSLPGLALGLATGWAVPGLGWLTSLEGAALGFGVFYGFAWLYERATGRAGLGGGDVKLLAMLGAFVGPMGVFATVLVSSIFGSVAGLGWALVQGRRDWRTVAIPYGPFLVVGALYYYLLGDILWFRFTTPT